MQDRRSRAGAITPERWRAAGAKTVASTYPRDDPCLAREVDGPVLALERRAPQTNQELVRATAARS